MPPSTVPPKVFPIADLLGFTVAEMGDGRATVRFDARECHRNVQGTLHGGVLCDIADAAMGNAYRTGLAEGESFTTVELKINFLRPVRIGHDPEPLLASGRVVWRGRRLGYMECDVTNRRSEVVARASCTCITLGARRAES